MSISSESGVEVVTDAYSDGNGVCSADDASLIAAAPDLYDALAEVVALSAHEGNTILKRLCEAALAKARGEG